MEFWALVLALAGATVSLGAAVWLLRSDPNDPKYGDDGELYPGRQQSLIGPLIVREQRRVAAWVTIGATLQLVGGVLALIAFLSRPDLPA